MKIKKYSFELKVLDFENEKWDETISIRAVSLRQATEELWNTLSEHLDLEELAQVTITNLIDLRAIDRD
jgi:hypothetical protein